MNRSIHSAILARIRGAGRGHVFGPKDFLDTGSPDAVRQVLKRLASEGTLRRLRRGVYDYPAFSALLGQPASPDPDAMARAIARAHGWTIQPTGETALNLLGLSTQVPAQWRYLSDGPSRGYEWAAGTLTFRHRANRETSILSPRTALLVQALKALGRDRVDDAAMAKLTAAFGRKDLVRAAREARYATSWVYEVVKRLAAAVGGPDHA